MDGSYYFQDLPAPSERPCGASARTSLVLTAALTAVVAAMLLVAARGGTELLAPTLDAASLFLG